jgi:hypothetical protein
MIGRFARFLFSLACVLVVIWFATNVNLGKRTLWSHLRAIFASQEARELADGTREEARKVAEKVREELGRDGGAQAQGAAQPDMHPAAPEAHAAAKPLDPVTPKDQKSLDKLVHDKTHHAKK